MLNFKKLASTFIFSVLAFQSTACAVPRYAKVVLLGGKGSGKTTIQKLINKDYDISNIPHTTQISYISVPVFYDNKGNFTFDEDRDVQRYNKEVILNICDTPFVDVKEEEKEKIDLDYSYDEDEVIKFANKRPNVLVFLANEEECDIRGAKLAIDYSFVKCLSNISNNDARRLVVVTHSHANKGSTLGCYLKSLLQDDRDDQSIDVIKVLTFFDGKVKEENKKNENNKIENKYGKKFANKNVICKEATLKYISKLKEVFNQNSKEDLKKYADVILNSIARSVYKYGINNLPFDSNESDWSIIDGKLTKGH